MEADGDTTGKVVEMVGSGGPIGLRPAVLLTAVLMVVPLTGCSGGTSSTAVVTESSDVAPLQRQQETSGTATASVAARPSVTAKTTQPPAPGASAAARGSAAAPAAGALPTADLAAGLLSKRVGRQGKGELRTVPGSRKAPGRGRIVRVRVQVEAGLDVDAKLFADFVLRTLNDRRSWTEDGRRRFARTDGPADVRVVLASPALSASICRPLRTFGRLSCAEGDRAVLTHLRWVRAMPGYDRTAYRRYLVNHEVGHVLGHRHEYCPGPGRRAPVMMQQTKGLKGCRPNPWPHP